LPTISNPSVWAFISDKKKHNFCGNPQKCTQMGAVKTTNSPKNKKNKKKQKKWKNVRFCLYFWKIVLLFLSQVWILKFQIIKKKFQQTWIFWSSYPPRNEINKYKTNNFLYECVLPKKIHQNLQNSQNFLEENIFLDTIRPKKQESKISQNNKFLSPYPAKKSIKISKKIQKIPKIQKILIKTTFWSRDTLLAKKVKNIRTKNFFVALPS